MLAVEVAELITSELDISINTLQFYTDSKVVLGYIYNQTRRFYVYVSNRVQRIREFTKPEQWRYVCTTQNPADHATRSVPVAKLTNTTWLTGPAFLSLPEETSPSEEKTYELVTPDQDTEVRCSATAISVPPSSLGCHRFEQFSSWKSLVRAIASLRLILLSRRIVSAGISAKCLMRQNC